MQDRLPVQLLYHGGNSMETWPREDLVMTYAFNVRDDREEAG